VFGKKWMKKYISVLNCRITRVVMMICIILDT
jgi:hypothetical protein